MKKTMPDGKILGKMTKIKNILIYNVTPFFRKCSILFIIKFSNCFLVILCDPIKRYLSHQKQSLKKV